MTTPSFFGIIGSHNSIYEVERKPRIGKVCGFVLESALSKTISGFLSVWDDVLLAGGGLYDGSECDGGNSTPGKKFSRRSV